jgi:AbrB family looped-hinge helix DNA binding protein
MADLAQMSAVIADHDKVSDKIRALDRAGYSRSEIARFLGKRYQHVRNVLVGDEQAGRSERSKSERPAPPIETEQDVSRSFKVRVDNDGRIDLPAVVRAALSLKEGDILFARLDDGEIHLLTPKAAMLRAQAIVRKFVPEGVSLVDELLEDRRREVEREQQRG